ncbi:hypothetical protein [Streptomyces sp. NPDC015131]|uniref:hypothetical protein n=1 Tax=Streptomyces sp. NPDC015131 TaxID=3364941 RepID=UPI0036FF6666
MTKPDTVTEDHVRNLHHFALEARVRLLMRTGEAQDAATSWAMASGTAAAWYAHRLLARLEQVDPEGVKAFAAELAEEGEMPDLADDPVEIAEGMGFNPQAWLDAEWTRRDACKAGEVQ